MRLVTGHAEGYLGDLIRTVMVLIQESPYSTSSPVDKHLPQAF